MAETPHRLGDYFVVAPLGHGGMARVDLAMREGHDEIVVLKQLLAGLEDHDETAQRFLREATIASALEHPGIARVHDVFEESQRVCLAMEFVPGVTFEELNKRCWKEGPPCPPAVAVSLVKQLLEALEYAHDFAFDGRPAGIVHRDLSTKNLMLGFNGRVKVIDFGVAKGEVDDLRTATGMLMGTPLYMSPEQAKGLRVDRRSDLYTAGVVLWEMLAGRRLVKAKGRAAMLHAVASQSAPPISTVAEVTSGFDEVIARALTKEPEDRFSTAGEFLTALVPVAAQVGLLSAPELASFVVERLPDRESEIAEQIRAARAAGPHAPKAVARIQLTNPGQLPPPRAEPRPLVAATAEETNASFQSAPIEAPRRGGAMWAVLGGLLVLGGIFGFQGLREDKSVEVSQVPRAPAVVPRTEEAPAPEPTPTPLAASEAPADPETSATDAPKSTTEAKPEPKRPVAKPASSRTEPVGTLVAGDEAREPKTSRSPERSRLEDQLKRYVQSSDPGAAAKLVVQLRRVASKGTDRRRSCMDPVLDDLLRADYNEVEDVRPLFLEAIECL
ncbi:MAG: protein kinase [Myxococcota bacterium]